MPVKSEAQRRAMWSALEGHSTLGIPKSVGAKFVGPEAHDMTPDNWSALIANLRKFFTEEGKEGEHSETEMAELKDVLTKFFHEEAAEPEHKEGEDDFPLGALLRRQREGQAKDEMPLLAFLQKPQPATFNLDWTHEVGKRPVLAMDRRSVRTYDRDGQLHVERTPLTKANICEYMGSEIPKAEELGLDPKKLYRLLRDPAELKKAAATSNGKQLLIKHIPVDANDHQPDVTVGAIGTNAEYEHPYLYNGLTVHAKDGIEGIENNKRREISAGYHYDADMQPGVYEGEPYDGVMRNISFNHFALVPEGRAGSDVLVHDSAQRPIDLSAFMVPIAA